MKKETLNQGKDSFEGKDGFTQYNNIEQIEDFQEWKAYEEAYQNLKEQDAPDLWERIEVGIEKEQQGKKKDKHPKRRTIILSSSLVAAAILFVIIIPFATGFFNTGMGNNYDMAENFSTQLEDTMYEETTENSCSNEEGITNSMEFAETELAAQESVNSANTEETLDSDTENIEENIITEDVSEEESKEFKSEDKLQNSSQNTMEVKREENTSQSCEKGKNDKENAVAYSMFITKEKEKDVTELVKISFDNLYPHVQNMVKEEIEDYKNYEYYWEKDSGFIYLKKGKVIYCINGAELVEE